MDSFFNLFASLGVVEKFSEAFHSLRDSAGDVVKVVVKNCSDRIQNELKALTWHLSIEFTMPHVGIPSLGRVEGNCELFHDLTFLVFGSLWPVLFEEHSVFILSDSSVEITHLDNRGII